MSSTNSPNMNLTIPTIGSEAGPQYASDINASLGVIDSHNHTTGSGVPITQSAISISGPLTLNGNFLTNVAGVTLVGQSSAPANGSLFQNSSGFLTYVDQVTGNVIPLTTSNGVAGSPGTIGNLAAPASLNYISSSQTFQFQSGTNISANLDAASLNMRNITPNSTYALTLQPPASLSANYSLTLPSNPSGLSGKSYLTIDASGNITANDPYVYPIPTAAIATQAITQAKLAARATGTTVSAGGVGIATSSGATQASVGSQLISGLSVTITTTGRPVVIAIVSQPGIVGDVVFASSGGSSPGGSGFMTVLRGGSTNVGSAIYSNTGVITLASTSISKSPNPAYVATSSGGTTVSALSISASTTVDFTLTGAYPLPGVVGIDPVSAGTYTYTVNLTLSSGSYIEVDYPQLVVYEM